MISNCPTIVDLQGYITSLQGATTGLTYNSTGDLSTLDNNLSLTSGKVLTVDGQSVGGRLNTLESNVTSLQGATTGLTYNSTGDLSTLDNNLTLTSGKVLTVDGQSVGTRLTTLESSVGGIDLTYGGKLTNFTTAPLAC